MKTEMDTTAMKIKFENAIILVVNDKKVDDNTTHIEPLPNQSCNFFDNWYTTLTTLSVNAYRNWRHFLLMY